MKKLLSILLVLAIIIPITSINNINAKSKYSGSCGLNAKWKLNTKTGLLTIYGKGNINNFTGGKVAPWQKYSKYIKTVNIKSGVDRIGIKAFAKCNYITKITIADTVASIGHDAFYLTIDDDNVSLSSCSCRLKNIVVSSANKKYKSVKGNLYSKNGKTLIQYAIGKKSTSFTVPSSVTKISYKAFAYNKYLKYITVPKTVTYIDGQGFSYCQNLYYVKGLKGVQTLGAGAFTSCTKLYNIKLPANIESLEPLTFSNCTSLKTVTLPANLVAMGEGCFFNCKSLKAINIPKNVKTIPYQCFYKCKKLSSVIVPKAVTFIDDYALAKCDSLKNIYYIGSKANFKKITIYDTNDSIKNAKITYNYK